MTPVLHGAALLAKLRNSGEIPATTLAECPTEADPEVVLGEDLAPIIQRMIDEDRKLVDTDAYYGDGQPIGLTSRMELNHGINPRVLYRVLGGESATVTLALADRILSAMDLCISDETLDLPIYRRSETMWAVKMQTEMMMQRARSMGEYIPPVGHPHRRFWPEVARRRYNQSVAA